MQQQETEDQDFNEHHCESNMRYADEERVGDFPLAMPDSFMEAQLEEQMKEYKIRSDRLDILKLQVQED